MSETTTLQNHQHPRKRGRSLRTSRGSPKSRRGAGNIETTTYPGMSATYSPEDNKLRLSSLHRLSPELYARVRAQGVTWAPKQDVFIAPMWTPGREDLLIELCGEIGDEDSTLMERAAERADRFEDYSERRGVDAAAAHAAVQAIAGRFERGRHPPFAAWLNRLLWITLALEGGISGQALLRTRGARRAAGFHATGRLVRAPVFLPLAPVTLLCAHRGPAVPARGCS